MDADDSDDNTQFMMKKQLTTGALLACVIFFACLFYV